MVARFQVNVATRTVKSGRLGDQVDHPAGGIAAIEGALRPPQHLYACEVVDLDWGLPGRQGNLVDVQRDARFFAADSQGTDAPDADVGIADVVRRVVQVRDEPSQIVETDDASVLDHGIGERGDRHWHLLYVFLDALRRDDDFFDQTLFCIHRGGMNEKHQ